MQNGTEEAAFYYKNKKKLERYATGKPHIQASVVGIKNRVKFLNF